MTMENIYNVIDTCIKGATLIQNTSKGKTQENKNAIRFVNNKEGGNLLNLSFNGDLETSFVKVHLDVRLIIK